MLTEIFAASSIAALVAGLVWRGRAKDRAATHPLRKRLLDLIRRRPGVRMAALWRTVGANRGTAKYHLVILERAKVVEATRTSQVTRYFAPDLPLADRPAISLLLRGRVLEIARKILLEPGATQSELTGALNISRKVFRTYVDLLQQSRLLEERREPHRRRYYPTDRLRDMASRVPAEEDRGEEGIARDVPGDGES